MVKQLLDALGRLGFTQYEARAYTALLRTPRITGYELSKRSGIPQSKIYEVLDKLAQKELIVSVEEGGFAQYIPLDPAEAVSRYRQEYAQALDMVDEQLRSIYMGDHESAAYVLNLASAKGILGRANEMIASAKVELYLMVWPDELPEVLEGLIEAGRRGVRIAICVYGDEDPGVGVVYHHEIDEGVFKNQQGGRRLVLAVDHREVLLAHFLESREATGHWSSNMGFVEMGVDYVRHDIFTIRMAQDFGSLLTEKYGPSRERLRDVFSPDGVSSAHA